jgi:hypothetical protein
MALFSKEYLTKQRRYFDMKKEASIMEDAVRSKSEFDIFLSHSYQDRDIIGALFKVMEEEMDFKIYVDWIVDTELDRTNVTAATAQRLKERMNLCKCLLFATSENQPKSKWMPWELGYFDGMKEKVAICQLSKRKTPRIATLVKNILVCILILSFKRNSRHDRLWVHIDERTMLNFGNGFLGNYLIFIRGEIHGIWKRS